MFKILLYFKLGNEIRSNAKASHILIGYEGTKFQIKRTKEEAKAKGSILAQVNL
jgi:hypothetical protein